MALRGLRCAQLGDGRALGARRGSTGALGLHFGTLFGSQNRPKIGPEIDMMSHLGPGRGLGGQGGCPKGLVGISGSTLELQAWILSSILGAFWEPKIDQKLDRKSV